MLRYRGKNANLRTQLLRIISKASASSWPWLFHNLQASRATELVNAFPIHVVCEWIGNVGEGLNADMVAKSRELLATLEAERPRS